MVKFPDILPIVPVPVPAVEFIAVTLPVILPNTPGPLKLMVNPVPGSVTAPIVAEAAPVKLIVPNPNKLGVEPGVVA